MGIRSYVMLAKPGIIMGNAITMVAGFALASKGQVHWALLFTTLAGLACIIASAGIVNNFIDRKADAKMARTKQRALASGSVPVQKALASALLLGISGMWILGSYTTPLALTAALAGFAIYLFLYTPLKYRTPHATLVGAVAGAMPPLVGYFAANGSLGLEALLLFAIVLLWQMPHFFAIAIFRLEDYTAASVPVLPAVRGTHATKIHMAAYTAAFAIATPLPSLFHFTGATYFAIAILLGLSWLALSLRGFFAPEPKPWARQMFLFSLVAILIVSFSMGIDKI